MTGHRSGPTRGWFLTIEGPEGAGKTTQAARLRDRAVAAGLEVVLTREPGGTAVGERVRALLLDPAASHAPQTDALLFNAARAQLVADVIRPALERGALVISTRFADSTLAYQGYGAGVPLEELREVARVAVGDLVPDRTLLLDLPVEIGLARKGAEQTRFETGFGPAFHRRVREGFLALAAAEPQRFVVIDATRSPKTIAGEIVGAASAVPGLGVLSPPQAGASEPERLVARIHP